MKYFIKFSDCDEMEVSKEKYMIVERYCEFYPKTEGETATLSFVMEEDGIKIKGRTEL
jgi:hypothetical protein